MKALLKLVLVLSFLTQVGLIADDLIWSSQTELGLPYADFQYIYSKPRSVIATQDGGYAIVGFTQYRDMNVGNIYISKYSSLGEVQWETIHGDTTVLDDGLSICQTNDGGFAVTGMTASLNFDDYNIICEGNIPILKFNSEGNYEWTKYLTECGDGSIGTNIRQLSDGSLVVFGQKNMLGYEIAVLYKTDEIGNIEWEHSTVFTQNSHSYAHSMEVDTDGNILVSYYAHDIDGNAVIRIDKVSPSGDLLIRHVPEGFTGVNSFPTYIRPVSDGGYLILQTEPLDYNDEGPILRKYSHDFELEWELPSIWDDQLPSALNVFETINSRISMIGFSLLEGTMWKRVYNSSALFEGIGQYGVLPHDGEYYGSFFAPMFSNYALHDHYGIPTSEGGLVLIGQTNGEIVGDVGKEIFIERYAAPPPARLRITENDNPIRLTWNDSSYINPILYEIYRDTQSPAATPLTTVAITAGGGSYTDNAVENGLTYFYRVRAKFDNEIYSSYSEEVSALVNSIPVITHPGPISLTEAETKIVNLIVEDADDNTTTLESIHDNSKLRVDITDHQLEISSVNDFFGSTSITIVASDGFDSDMIDVSVEVTPVNDRPTAYANDYSVMETMILEMELAGSPGPSNESDQSLMYIITSLPTEGYLSPLENGAALSGEDIPFTLDVNRVYFWQDERFEVTNFEFRVQDNGGIENGGIDLSESATISVSLNIPNQFSLSTSGAIEGGVTVIDGNILYVASSGDGVHRYDENGSAVYTLNVNGDIKSSTTITSNHIVYIASTDNNLYSFNANGTSNTGWPVSLGAEATASVAVDATGTAYIGTSNGIFQAVTDAGIVSWGYNVGGAVYASAAISTENVLYIANENGRVFAFDLETISPSSVEPAWVYDLGEGVHSSPALDDLGNLYVTTIAGNLIKLEDIGTAAQEVWQYSTGGAIYSSPIIGSDYSIYFGCNDGHTYAIDADGSLRWESAGIMTSIVSSPALAESGTAYDRLYIGSDDGYLYALSLIDGSITWKYDAESPIQCPIVFSDAIVYFGTQAGDVIAIKDEEVQSVLAKMAAVNTIWPTFQGNNARTGVFGGGASIPAISRVYPGDTDNDGDVDALDVLPIGVYFLEQGNIRNLSTLGWSSQDVASWDSYPANYADCNGDGVIDEKDLVAIGVNWGKTHSDGLTKYRVDPDNQRLLKQHKESFEQLYRSLSSNQGAPGRAMKRVLEEVLGVLPSKYALYQNYPNPFNPDTEIQFSLPKTTQVSLRVYNIRGGIVAELVDGETLQGGYHTEVFIGSEHSSGIYFYELRTPEFNAVNKMLLVK